MIPWNKGALLYINDDFDSAEPNSVNNDFAGIKNWFNEFYARDTSRKIRAVQKAKGERGVPLTTNVLTAMSRTRQIRSTG